MGDVSTRYIFDLGGNYNQSGAAMCGTLTGEEIKKIYGQVEFAVIEAAKEKLKENNVVTK